MALEFVLKVCNNLFVTPAVQAKILKGEKSVSDQKRYQGSQKRGGGRAGQGGEVIYFILLKLRMKEKGKKCSCPL